MPPVLDSPLLLVSGKGGVGKSTLTAAVALSQARAGQRTLVCEVNAEERVSRLLERKAAGSQIRLLEDNLWAVDIRPEEAMREYGLMVLKFKGIYHAVFENRIVERFLRFIPSLAELVMLGKIIHHVQERLPNGAPRFQRVIVDAPATGHALSFFSVPDVLMKTVPPGPLFSQAENMRAVLTRPTVTCAVVVAVPEELPVNEAVELAEGLASHNIRIGAFVLNAWTPERFSERDLTALVGSGLETFARADAERAHAAAESQRKLQAVGPSVLTLPRLFDSSFGRAGIERLAGLLKEGGALP